MYSGVGVVCVEAIVDICVEAIVNIGVVAVGRPMLRIVMIVVVVRMMVARPKVPPILAGDFVGSSKALTRAKLASAIKTSAVTLIFIVVVCFVVDDDIDSSVG